MNFDRGPEQIYVQKQKISITITLEGTDQIIKKTKTKTV